MIVQGLLIAMLLAQPAAAPSAEAAPETPAPAAPAQPAPMTTDEAIARIDALLTPWKGKSGERLRGRLGLSEATRDASDGQAVFWIRRSEATACGVGAGGVIRCGVVGGAICRLAIAFDKTGKVVNWKATGTGDACELFHDEIGSPG